MSHEEGRVCVCVRNHNPNPMELHRHHSWPTGMGGHEDGPVNWLCPTTHVSVHELIREWVRYEGEPPWEPDETFVGRKRYGRFCRDLAEIAYRAWDEAGRP